MQFLKITDRATMTVEDEDYDAAQDLAIDFLSHFGHDSDDAVLDHVQTALIAGILLGMNPDRPLMTWDAPLPEKVVIKGGPHTRRLVTHRSWSKLGVVPTTTEEMVMVIAILDEPIRPSGTGPLLSNATRREAIDWLSDCAWTDMEPEDIAELTDAQIMQGINRHYEGGWEAFIEAGS